MTKTWRFIVELESKNPTFDGFRKALIENGAEFPDSLISNLQRIIKLMKPSMENENLKDGEANVASSSKSLKKTEKLALMFPGLALANDKFSKLDEESSNSDSENESFEEEKKSKSDVKRKVVEKDLKIVDEAMLELEALAPDFTEKSSKRGKSAKNKIERKSRSRSKSREHCSAVDRDSKRHQNRDKEITRASNNDRHRDRDHGRRSRSSSRDRRRRSRSRDRSRRSRSRSPRRRHRRSRSSSRERKHERRRRSRSKERSRRLRSRSRENPRRSRSRSADRSRIRRRSRSNETKMREKMPPPTAMADDPEPGKIYSGKVANIVPFGCFVQIFGLRKRWEGLVHISQLRSEGRVTDVTEVVNRNSNVKVKVMSVTGQKVSLSMKEVDQETGQDLNPLSHAPPPDSELKDRNPDRPFGGGTSLLNLQGGGDNDEDDSRKRVTRISSPERWEIKQMISSGVLDRSEMPDFDEETGLLAKDEDDEEDIEIEIVEEEPPFLAGHGRALHDLSPVRIVKIQMVLWHKLL
ncbi:ATP-dependent RNA helicase DHX8 [Eumeta japonica]|uniref:ATP-dependent RNA helicase DHX8 n=1 Tax=Eumeta variegata TaxID=151549 RepID=A0A4C1TVA8_EUMVA|nr:ATP-dependent RNA helicase DHX8 [Eumeta japonica]